MWLEPSAFCGGDQSKIDSWLFRRCIEPWGAIGVLSKLCVIKTLRQPQQVSRKRRKLRIFFRCSFYTVTRDYPQKLVALKIIIAAGKYPDSCIVSLHRRTHWLLGNRTMSLSPGEQCPSQDHRTMCIRLLVSTKWLGRTPQPSYIAARPACIIPAAHNYAFRFRPKSSP